MKTTLAEILKYRHPGVEKRFMKFFNKTEQEAAQTFSDLMRFFWASEKHDKEQSEQINESELNFVFIMDDEMKPIDDIWHIFLLYTKDYMDFCDKYFGEYIHHLPDIVPGMEQTEEQFETNLTRFINYNYNLLGHETMERWFREHL